MSHSAVPVIARRYQLVDQLGSGGMGAVYRALDRLSGQSIALKRVLTHSDPEIASSGVDGVDLRIALANEFRLMASLRHPHIIGVLDYGFDEERLPYYTMDLLEQPQTILEAATPHEFKDRVRLVIQVLQGLAYTHRRGIIHRDLKPKNILVTRGDVKVLDFGLSILRGQQQGGMESTVGTLAYMAPEVLMGGNATESSDLYAVGVMAYEIFAGKHPFEGENVVAMLKSILYTPPDLINVDMDYDLALILERVLAKNPEDRYDSAEEFISALGAALREPLAVETSAIRDSFLQAARLIGRDHELGLLSEALHRSRNGQGSSWLIGGESGVGKSRLLDEVGTMAMVQGALVLRGQAVDQGGTPYQLWRPALRWLSLLSDLDDRDLAVLEPYVPGISSLLGRSVAANTETQARNARSRLQQLTETMLRRQQQPIVIMLEDLQWAGSESLTLLTHLNKIVGKLPLLIIGSYRDDERSDLPALLPEMQSMRLTRLSEDAIAELSEAMLGPRGRDEHVVELLRRETEGNVFFLIEVVRALAEEAGRLDQIGVATLPPQVFAGGMQRIIQRRLDLVRLEDRELLRMAAIMGREFDLQLLKSLAPNVNLEHWLNNCANAAVIEMQDGQWRFAHDKLRNGVVQNMSPAECVALHRTVAKAIESMYGESADCSAALSYHWAEAGDHDREAHYATIAGEYALRNGAYHEALDFLQRALAVYRDAAAIAGADQTTYKKTTSHLKQKIAETYAAMGRYTEAAATFTEALGLAKEVGDQAATAEIFMSLGDVAYVTETFEQAERYYQDAHDLFDTAKDLNGVMRALNNLGNVAYDLDDYTKANQLYQRSLALSREIGNQWGMAGSFAASDAPGDDL